MRALKPLAAVGLVLLIFSVFLLIPCTQQVRESSARTLSGYKVKIIAVALLTYHDTYKKLPPAVIRDKAGKPLYSWRVALLPFLEQDILYKRFKLDEPWDSAHNKALLDFTAPPYGVGFPEDPPGTTRYQVLVGPGTAFERDGLTWKDFPDGLADTLLVIESGTPVPWSKPADLVYDPNGPLPALGAGYAKPTEFLCYEIAHRPGFNAGFADGALRFLVNTNNEEAIRSLITRNGGEMIDWSKLE